METPFKHTKDIEITCDNKGDTWMVNSITINKDKTKVAFGIRIFRPTQGYMCMIDYYF